MAIQKQTIELVLQAVSELLEKMGITADVSSETREHEDAKELLVINIDFHNPSLLIGQQGVNLNAFQHIARILVRRKTEEQVNFIVDVNEYKMKRIEYLKSLASDVAKRVLENSKFEVLRAMSSYERRIIHMELAKNDQVTTESLGEEPNRRIVVRPASEKSDPESEKSESEDETKAQEKTM